MHRVLLCGIDEVGRGCLAGPIIAVAASFLGNEKDFELPPCPVSGLKDSKKFSSREAREKVFEELIHSSHLIDMGVGIIGPEEIDQIGIEEANAQAFFYALDNLEKEPDFLYVDGTKPVRHFQRTHQLVKPKADDLYWPVSGASILAKVIRDRYMEELHQEFPQYLWNENAGYGTKAHTEAIKQHGAVIWHRQTFLKKLFSASQ